MILNNLLDAGHNQETEGLKTLGEKKVEEKSVLLVASSKGEKVVDVFVGEEF